MVEQDKITIDLSDEIDRNRYRCPAGHAYWVRTNRHFWCRSCSESSWQYDPEFHELVDAKTGETVPRERIRFVERNPSPVRA